MSRITARDRRRSGELCSLCAALIVFFCTLGLAVLIAVLVKDGQVVLLPPEWKPFDVASILVATAGIILAATAVIIAVAGVVGYAQLRDLARTTAEAEARQEAQRVVEKFMQEEGLPSVKREAADFLSLESIARQEDRTEDEALTTAIMSQDKDAKPDDD